MKKNLILFLSLVLLLAVPMVSWAQDAPTPQLEITGVNASQLPSVTISANVFDTLGQPLTGLTSENFTFTGTLAERSNLIEVKNISDDNLPFASVLVMDVSSSMADTPITRAKEAARDFISAIGPNDPVAIVSFSSDVRVVLDYTTDKELLLSTIDSIGVGGKTALYDAGLIGVQKAADSPLPRRAVILLSDGAEYGERSTAERGAALNEARIRGVPVYTIGLGFGTDRTYLQQLSDGTNARFFESPTPNELIEIYRNLATLLRSQYVLTLEVNVPADGGLYDFVLQAETPEGATNAAEGTLRAPIPVPIVAFPPAPAEPIDDTFAFTAIVGADDEITSVEFLLDGQPVVADGYTITIDPATLAPGPHTLSLTIVDKDGDTGTSTLNFEVAALPSVVTVFSELETGEISEPQTIMLNITGQTAVQSVTYSIDGEGATTVDTEPYEFSIDPFTLAPGAHTLTIEVLNEGGVTSTVTQNFIVAALPPNVSLDGLNLTQPLDGVTEIVVDAVGQSTLSSIDLQLNGITVASVTDLSSGSAVFPIDPMSLPPGVNTLTVAVTDAAGQVASIEQDFEVAALPPIVSFTGIEAGATIEGSATITVDITSQTDVESVTYSVDGSTIEVQKEAPFAFELDITDIESGDHTLTIDVLNAGGQHSISEVEFSVSERGGVATITQGPTNTATNTVAPTNTDTAVPSDTAAPSNTAAPSDTPTPNDQATDAAATDAAIAAQIAVATANMQATRDTRATEIAEATVAMQATRDARQTMTAEAPTLTDTDVAPSDTATQAEVAAQPTDTATKAPTDASVTNQPADDETPENAPTLTPVEISEVTAPSTDSGPDNSMLILIIVIIVVAVLVVLFMIWRNRQQPR